MKQMITILGPTACGKTALAVALAARLDAEIISADSRQVYRGMDIGTGKDLADYQVEGKTIPYYGILDGEIICEATAVIDPEPARRSRGLVDEQTAYLEAFRTNEPFMGQGYFSRLFAFMLEDLRRRGYRRVTLGVETNDMKNKAIYTHYGFTGYLTTEQERYPDGTTVEVEYYAKTLFTDGISSEAGESPES